MNSHKFCFIICTNNSLLLEESIHYINHLHVPSGYEITLLTISDAASMTSGYNEGMAASDAKYKIYMHQDVFILNKNILSDLLAIFQSDPQIGMIGMVGYDEVSLDGIMWHAAQRRGNIYQKKPTASYPCLSEYHYSLEKDGFHQAAEIDGFLMATSHDLPWNTELLKDWDFYDAFQSINFLQHGYKIAVPFQRHPWCMHDDGKFLNMDKYNKYRQIFVRTYKEYLGKSFTEIFNPNFPAPSSF